MIEPILSWTADDVTRGGGAAASMTTNPAVAEEATKLDRWFGFETEVFLCPSIASSACAAGIVLNLDQIQRVCKEEVAVDPMAVVAYVLAHEKSHHAQAKQYGGWAALQASSVAYELQADFIAGVWIGANILVRDFNFLMVADAAFRVGDPNWPGGTHPAPEQRHSAVNRGVAAAARLVHLQQLGGPLGEGIPLYESVNMAELMGDSFRIAKEIEGGRI